MNRDFEAGVRNVRRAKAERAWLAHVRHVCRIQQDVFGFLMAVVPIIINWFLAEFYGQFEYIMLTMVFVISGIYTILTRRNHFYEMWREEHKK